MRHGARHRNWRRRTAARGQLIFAAAVTVLLSGKARPARAERAPSPGRDAAPAPSPIPVAPPQESGKDAQAGPRVDLLTFYRQNYFASGFSSETPVKFQISLQYELWPNRTSHAVRFAYTQKSLWDLWAFNESSPFLETNYEPELFYLHRGRLTRDDTARGCGLGSGQLGLDHESNGRGGARSRAWNRVYGAARFMCTGSAQAFASATARLWWPFGTADNPDITDFLGFGEMELAARTPDPFAWYGTFELWVTLRKGASAPLERGSVLGELAWNPGYGGVFGRLWRFTPYLYAQLFAGYGETLISYDRSDLSARAGLGLRDYARPAP